LGLGLVSAALVAGNLALLGTLPGASLRLAAAIGALSCGAGFLWVEARAREPMVRLSTFADRLFSGATLAGTTGWFATLSTSVYVAMYLQSGRGMTLLPASLIIVSWSAVASLSALTIDRLVRAFGARAVLVTSCPALFATVLPWAFVRYDWPLWLPAVLLAAFGVAQTCLLTVTFGTALSGFQPGEAGLASATYNATRQIGSSLGIAVPGAVVAALAASGGAASHAALDGPLEAAFAVRAAVVAVGTAGVLVLLLPRPERTGARAAASPPAPESDPLS
jgi:hypothetical protein